MSHHTWPIPPTYRRVEVIGRGAIPAAVVVRNERGRIMLALEGHVAEVIMSPSEAETVIKDLQHSLCDAQRQPDAQDLLAELLTQARRYTDKAERS